MVGSSLRNSVHRRNHKERAQPLARAKLGLLEKKKDYILRARDYKSKKERLKRLREKAAFRNKDEFYFGMIKSRTQGGVHIKERDTSGSLGADEIKLLKSQDAGYVRVAIAKDESKIAALKNQLQMLTTLFPSSSSSAQDPDAWSDMDDLDSLDGDMEEIGMETLVEAGIVKPIKSDKWASKAKTDGQVERGHVVFTDDKDELMDYSPPKSITASASKLSSAAQVEELDLGWVTTNRQKSKKGKERAPAISEDGEDAGSISGLDEDEIDIKRAEQRRVEQTLKKEANEHRHLLLLELQQRLARVTQLKSVLAQIDLQKQMMGKGGVMKKRDAERIVMPSLRKGRKARENKRDDESDDEDQGKVVHIGRVMKWKAERKR